MGIIDKVFYFNLNSEERAMREIQLLKKRRITIVKYEVRYDSTLV